MTCIVGVVGNGVVHIGGDSAASNGHHLLRVAAPKVFKLGRLVVGYTSSFRFGDILEHELEVPTVEGVAVDRRWMIKHFVPAMREALKAGGYAQKSSEQESGGTCLVGVRGKLFEVQDDYSVLELADGYAAVGSGTNFALGALATLRARGGFDAALAAATALEVAGKHCSTVCGPYYVVSTEGA